MTYRLTKEEICNEPPEVLDSKINESLAEISEKLNGLFGGKPTIGRNEFDEFLLGRVPEGERGMAREAINRLEKDFKEKYPEFFTDGGTHDRPDSNAPLEEQRLTKTDAMRLLGKNFGEFKSKLLPAIHEAKCNEYLTPTLPKDVRPDNIPMM